MGHPPVAPAATSLEPNDIERVFGRIFTRTGKPLAALHAAFQQVNAQLTCPGRLRGTCSPRWSEWLDVVVYIHVADKLFVFGLFLGCGVCDSSP